MGILSSLAAAAGGGVTAGTWETWIRERWQKTTKVPLSQLPKTGCRYALTSARINASLRMG
jgi:hypothetical protein